MLKNIAVFCGSYSGRDAKFERIAYEFAHSMSAAQMTLIYGGGALGLMGTLADTMLQSGRQVIGVIPKFLEDIEIAHKGLTSLHVVDSMHTRKALMVELADAFILLPGGAGSLDEFFEVYTWKKLGLHNKPCGILNAFHYYDHLIRFLDNTVQEGFLHHQHREMICIAETPMELLTKLVEPQRVVKPQYELI